MHGMLGPRPKRRRFEFQPADVVVKILVSPSTAGKIIGTGGAEVKALRAQTGVTVHIWENKFMGTGLQVVVLGGPRPSVDQALMFVMEKLVEEAQQSGSETSETISAQLLATRNTVSRIIGAKGATISQLRQEFGCHLEADKVPHQGEQVLKVNGPGEMVQQLLVKLTEFVEEAGDSQQVANNDYANAPDAGFMESYGPWSKGKAPSAKGVFGGKGPGMAGPPALMTSAGKGFGGKVGPGHGMQDHWQIDLLQAEQDPSVLSSVSTIQFAIPAESVSRVLGKGGVFSKEITRHTGAKLVIDPPGPGAETCVVTLTGQVGGVNRAHCMVVSRLLSQY